MFLNLTPSIYTDAVVPEVGRAGIHKKSENDNENSKMRKNHDFENRDALFLPNGDAK